MCSKSVVILLLGFALASADPIQGNGNLMPQPKNSIDIGSWFNNTHYDIIESFKQTTKPFVPTYNALVKTRNAQKYSVDEIEHLLFLFHVILDEGKESLSDIENAIMRNTITTLQKAIEFLQKRPSGKDSVQDINQNLKGTTMVPDKLTEENNAFGSEFENIFKNSLIVKVPPIDRGVQNVGKDSNEWFNNLVAGLKSSEGVVNNLGDQANKVFNTGKNTITNGMTSVKDNVNGWVNKGFRSISDKLGEGGHDAFGSEIENIIENTQKGKTSVNKHDQFLSNIESVVQSAVNGGPLNVGKHSNEWTNNLAAGLKSGEGVVNNLGDQTNKAFNIGKNTIANGMTSVNDNVNEWLNKGFVSISDKLGGGVHNAFGNGVDNIFENAQKVKASVNKHDQFLSNIGNTVPTTANGGVQNIGKHWNEWANNLATGLESDEGVVNNFGNQANKAFNTGKNIINNEITSVNDNVNKLINKRFASIIEKLGEEHDTFRSKVGNILENARKTRASVDEHTRFRRSLENTMQATVNSEAQDIEKLWKELVNNWMSGSKSGEGVLNNLGDQASKAFNTDKNTIGNGMESIKDNVNGLVNKGFVSISNKLGGGVYDEFESNVENILENTRKVKASVDEHTRFRRSLGNVVQRSVIDEAQNVKKHWMNNWTIGLKLGEGVFNNLGNQANTAFNTAKNTIGNGMASIKDNMNGWVNNGFLAAEGSNNIVSQSKDTFINKFNGSQNQLISLDPWRAIFEESHEVIDNVFDSKQTLDTIKKQLSKDVAEQLIKLEKDLNKWKNLVTSFLNNSSKSPHNLKQQSQEINEGINVPESMNIGIGVPKNLTKLISGKTSQIVEENVENGLDKITSTVTSTSSSEGKGVSQSPNDGVFKKIGEQVGGKIGSRIDKFTDKIDKITDTLIPISDGEKKVSLKPNEGVFNKIGQQVGGKIGNGIDKFNGAFGKFLNNAGNIFG